MMEININWLAVFLAMLSNMVIGSIWFAPAVLGSAWLRLGNIKKGDTENLGFRPIIIGALTAFITSYVMCHFIELAHMHASGSYLSVSLQTALWLWAGFSAARLLMHDAFEGRRLKFTALTTAYELAIFLAMGLIIGLLGVNG